MICILSSFLDNIAAALIGGAVAHTVFRGKIHIGYLAAIVAASNAGGAGSVVGDTTTTMMWIAGVPPLQVLHGYGGSFAAMFVCGIPAALVQLKNGSTIVTSALTGTNGAYTLVNVKPGTYTVVVSKTGYVFGNTPPTVTVGNNATANVFSTSPATALSSKSEGLGNAN